MVTPLFALMLLGYLSGKWRKLPLDGLAWLNFFILYIALPALFFQLLSRTPVERFANYPFLIATTTVTFAVFVLCFALTLLLNRGDIKVATITGFTGAYGNIGYMGPPLALLAFGPEAAVPVALIFCVDNAMHFTLAPLLMALGDDGKQRPLALLGAIIKQIFTHPFILATIAGIAAAVFQFKAPEALASLLDMLAGAAAPCALFAMGITAALRPANRFAVDLTYLVPIKLLLHPVLMYLVVREIPDTPTVWLFTAVLLASLPTATNVFVIAQNYRTWEQRASSAIAVSTALSIITVTVYLYLAQGDLI